MRRDTALWLTDGLNGTSQDNVVLADVHPSDVVFYLRSGRGFTMIMTEDGIVGFVKDKVLEEIS